MLQRYTGMPLRERPHIAVLFYEHVGNFVVATPLLRGLRERFPGCTIDYFGGEPTRSLEAASPLVDSRYSLYGRPGALAELADYLAARRAAAGPYDWAINLDASEINAVVTTMLAPRWVTGRAHRADGRGLVPNGTEPVDRLMDEVWAAPDLVERYRGVIESQFIGELWCRIARIATDYHRLEVPVEPPDFEVPDILIATSTTRTAKMWPAAHWQRFVEGCTARGLSVGLLGPAPAVQRELYVGGSVDDHLLRTTAAIDLRGRTTLPQAAGAVARARACVTIDTGIMHLAIAVGRPTLALFGASPWRVWLPQAPNLHLLLPEEPCDLCERNAFRNADCLRERHVCMLSITPERVLATLERALASPTGSCRQACRPGLEPRVEAAKPAEAG